jgi:hypothetical protein
MPLVFVHGVKVREGIKYSSNVNARNALFRRITLRGLIDENRNSTIFNPYWGKYGSKFVWDYASLPGKLETLGSGEDNMLSLLLSEMLSNQDIQSGNTLAQIARSHSLEDSIDLLLAVSSKHIINGVSSSWVDLALNALDYAQNNSHPTWLNEVSDDRTFLYHLKQEIADQAQESLPADSAIESLGGSSESWEDINEAVSRILGFIANISGKAFALVRPVLHREIVSGFLGDIFVYLKRPELIAQEIIQDLEKARIEANCNHEKLIIVAHSMGGVITYDILTHFLPDLKIDVFVTVGSQVAFFEELKLFHASDVNISATSQINTRVEKPPNINHWINIVDPNDGFSFSVDGIFSGAHDFNYSTGNGIISSHTTYFDRPSFHKRLNERIHYLYQ